MGEWSDYFEDFPDENPANQRQDFAGDALRRRVAREATYSPQVLAEMADHRKRREEEEIRLIGMKLRDREKVQAELHRSIGALMEAYAWLDVHLGVKIKEHSNSSTEVIALLKPSAPMKLRLDCVQRLVEQAKLALEVTSHVDWKAWIRRAEQIRLMRNDYAHGRWINSSLANTEFRFAPLSWPVESESLQTLEAVSAEQIDELTNEIWELTRSLSDVLAPYFPIRP